MPPSSSKDSSSKSEDKAQTAEDAQSPGGRNIFLLSDGQPREFMWACELTKDSPEAIWTFAEEDDDVDYIHHTLYLKSAILGLTAKKDERNIVQAETKNFLQKELKAPIVSLTLGRSDMCALDINFTHEIPVTFRLIEGTGPVHLTGQHVAELPPTPEDDAECSEDSYLEISVPADVDSDPEERVVEVKSKKRKGAASTNQATKKRAKPTAAKSTDEDEDDEEDDEDEDEEEEDDEESMEEEDEEEKEPEMKKKSKIKAKVTKKPPTPKSLKTKMKTNTGKAKAKSRAK